MYHRFISYKVEYTFHTNGHDSSQYFATGILETVTRKLMHGVVHIP